MPTHSPHAHDGHLECSMCHLDFDFELPEELIRAAHSRDLVIFAGAGISTEVPTVFPVTIMARAAEMLERNDLESFPATMQAFEEQFGRSEMVQMIKRKFDYVDSFRSLRWNARQFHRELATMPYIEDIVTTNWDTYFEEECAATPFISGEDIALWKTAGRKVLKMHGSISNLGSIIATEYDYTQCIERMNTNVLGSLLRNFLATKTVVFIGYSLQDWNFRWIYDSLISDMKGYAPRAYFVSPFGISDEDASQYRLKVIRTSGVNFLARLKEANYGPCFVRDRAYDRVDSYHDDICEAETFAKTISHKDYPAVVFCWSFHDGALDACTRISFQRRSGEYSSRQYLLDRINTYETLADAAYEEGRYWDHSYIEGYLCPLYIMLDDESDIDSEENLLASAPRYFCYGSDDDNPLHSAEQFAQAMESSRRRAPKQRKAARKIADRTPAGMVVTHEPFLQGLTNENPPLENEHAR